MLFYYYNFDFVMRCRVVVLIAFTVVIGWWPAVVVAWNTDRLYGTRMRARLTDLAVWRNRAYACWPRADASQPVTLLELPWPETVDEQPQQPSSWTPSRPFYADQQVSTPICVIIVPTYLILIITSWLRLYEFSGVLKI